MSKEAIKKITTDEFGNTLVTVQWGQRTFVVEISEEGVCIAPANKKGKIQKQSCPNVWVDPFVINDPSDQLDENDKGEAPLLVHSYFDNENEAPVTVRLYKKRASLGGDGLQFAERK